MPSDVEVITPIPTPFLPDGEVDYAGAAKLVKALPAEIDAFLVAGTTGEFPALTDDERIGLIEAVLAAAGPERVIAHVGAASARQAAGLAARAVAAGATRIAAITPYFLPSPPSAVQDYYEQVLEAAGVDTYAYLFPDRTGLTVLPEQLAELAELPHIVGAKLSGLAAADFAAFARAVPDGFVMYSGNDSELPEVVAAGGRGIVSGVSAAFPEPFLAQAHTVASSDQVGAQRHRSTITRVVRLVGPNIAALKLAVHLRYGLDPSARMALAAPSPVAVAQIEQAIEDLAPA